MYTLTRTICLYIAFAVGWRLGTKGIRGNVRLNETYTRIRRQLSYFGRQKTVYDEKYIEGTSVSINLSLHIIIYHIYQLNRLNAVFGGHVNSVMNKFNVHVNNTFIMLTILINRCFIGWRHDSAKQVQI